MLTDARIAANMDLGFCPKKRSAAVVPCARVRKKGSFQIPVDSFTEPLAVIR